MAFWACFCAALTITVSEESSYTPYGGTIFALVWVCASRAAVVRREQLERCREGHRRKELEELREGRRPEAFAWVTRRHRTLALVTLSAARKAREGSPLPPQPWGFSGGSSSLLNKGRAA
jgi:hypothetical protein